MSRRLQANDIYRRVFESETELQWVRNVDAKDRCSSAMRRRKSTKLGMEDI